MWSGLSLNVNQVGPRPSINIHQSRLRTSAIFGARAAQRRCLIASNLGQKYLFSDRWMERPVVAFMCLGWTSAFCPRGVPAMRHVNHPSHSSFIEFTPTFVQKFRTESILAQVHASLAEPDPYAGGEGLVTCNTRSCSAGM